MNIFAMGGYFDDDNDLRNNAIKFTKALGGKIIEKGHTLINCCITEFDAVVTESAYNKVLEKGGNPKDQIIGYVTDGRRSTHNFGKIKTSELKNWGLESPDLKIPEPILAADVIVSVCGFDGTQRGANWARIANKPLLPVVKFEGASKLIYREERNNFKNKYDGNITLDDFEDLSLTLISDDELAENVIKLAERTLVSYDVFAVMSFKESPDLIDAYNSFKDVCSKFDPPYNCLRMDEITNINRITPEMLNRIKKSAIVIVDLSLERPNVYYELGFADALEKPIIVTAKEGTKIHFDAKDFPILFWNSQTQLKKDLEQRIQQIANR
jgi:hypothetical protein